MSKQPPYAVIDVGTNTLILLIARPLANKKISVLHDQAIITRLGKGLAENHFFSPDAMKRSKLALEEFKKICQKHKVKKIVAVGTAGCRNAANAEVFLDQIKNDLKIKIEVISGDKEASLSFLSCFKEFGQKNEKMIVIDIGGGSTECISGPLNDKKLGPENLISLNMGSVKMTEHFVRSDPISAEDFSKLHQSIINVVHDELGNFYPKDFNPQKYTLVATAGTATTLCALNQRLKVYDSEKVHGAVLKIDSLKKIIQQLTSKTVVERQKMSGMEPLRADVILAGALILLELMNFYKAKQTLISDRGLRFGVFADRFIK